MPPDRDDPDEDAPTPRAPTRAELRRHRETYPEMPVLQGEGDDEDTPDVNSIYDDPIRVTRRDHEAARRAGRGDEPVTSVELSAIIRRLESRIYERIRRDHGRTMDRLADAIDGVGDQPGLIRTVASHSEVIGPARRTASWALRGVVAAFLLVGGFLYKRGADEQHVTDEIQALTDKVNRLERIHETQKDPRP